MQSIYKFIFFSFCCLLFLSLCSMMMVFMGASSTEVSMILQIEKFLLMPSVIYCILVIIFYIQKRNGLDALWQRTPGYLIFTLCIINSLTVSGFLAFHLVQSNMGKAPKAFELIPLLVGISSSIALLLSFSLIKRDNAFSSYRERLQAREENFPQNN